MLMQQATLNTHAEAQPAGLPPQRARLACGAWPYNPSKQRRCKARAPRACWEQAQPAGQAARKKGGAEGGSRGGRPEPSAAPPSPAALASWFMETERLIFLGRLNSRLARAASSSSHSEPAPKRKGGTYGELSSAQRAVVPWQGARASSLTALLPAEALLGLLLHRSCGLALRCPPQHNSERSQVQCIPGCAAQRC
jgi:hypothetical protein